MEGMNDQIVDASSIVGHRIKSVDAILTGSNPHTGHGIHAYLLELNNGQTFELAPESLKRFDGRNVNRCVAEAQIIDGPPTIEGEIILAVATRSGTGMGVPVSEAAETDFRQFALVLSSDRAALNVYRCGGGSILHIESTRGIERHLGGGWKDLWIGEQVALSSLGRQA